MKRFLTLALVGAVALGASSVVFANICAFDPVPAATLLFPFVEMDYNGAATTSFAITNVSSEAVIVHVTVWTDYSDPVLDFNVMLTGYDVQTFNIASILKDGWLPKTGHNANSPVGNRPYSDGPVSKSASVNGYNGAWVADLLDPPQSTEDLYTAGVCTGGNSVGDPSGYGPGTIPASILALFKADFMASNNLAHYYDVDCNDIPPTTPMADDSTYRDRGVWWLDADFNTNRPTWMYVTADVASQCNKAYPDSAIYWDPINPLALNTNVLMGDFFNLNPDTGFSSAHHAVHLEADVDIADVATVSPNNNLLATTFYARYSNTVPASDFREPLGTAWAFRTMDTGDGQYTTDILAFKAQTRMDFVRIPDLNATAGVSRFIASNCLAYTYYSWDEEENVMSGEGPGGGGFSGGEGGYPPPNLLPLETQKVAVSQFNVSDDFGWMLFVWPASNWDNLVGAPAEQYFYQTWMGVQYTAVDGLYTEGLDGVLMANYNCFSDQVLPNLGINYDYVDGLTGEYTKSPMLAGGAK